MHRRGYGRCINDWGILVRFTKAILLGAAAFMLAGCGGGVSTPEDVRGVWSDACPTGMLGVDADTIHFLYPSKSEFKLTGSEWDGKTWRATFTNASGNTITDNYVLENGQLFVDTVTVDGKTSTGNRIHMTKCD